MIRRCTSPITDKSSLIYLSYFIVVDGLYSSQLSAELHLVCLLLPFQRAESYLNVPPEVGELLKTRTYSSCIMPSDGNNLQMLQNKPNFFYASVFVPQQRTKSDLQQPR